MGMFLWQQKAVFQLFYKTPWQISYKFQIQEFSFPTTIAKNSLDVKMENTPSLQVWNMERYMERLSLGLKHKLGKKKKCRTAPSYLERTSLVGHYLLLFFSLDKRLITKILDCPVLPSSYFKVCCINGQNRMLPPSNKWERMSQYTTLFIITGW